MEEDTSTVDAGTKYLWAAAGGVVEIHGEDRKGWTHLDDHVWANSVPVEELEWSQGMDKNFISLFFVFSDRNHICRSEKYSIQN